MLFKFARILSRTVHSLPQYKMVLKLAVFGGLVAVLSQFLGTSIPVSVGASFAVYLLTGGWRFCRVIIKTLPRDLRALSVLISIKLAVRKLNKENGSVPSLFLETVRKHPNKIAFIDVATEKRWTFQDVEEYSNAVANYFHKSGYQRGDVVAMFMESRPEYVGLWLGMAKVGVVPALINFNLRMDSLAHCIQVAEAKAVVCGSELQGALKEALPMLPRDTKLFCQGEGQGDLPAEDLDAILSKSSRMAPPSGLTNKVNDKLFYIYTSGTTGLPKAAIVIHSRCFNAALCNSRHVSAPLKLSMNIKMYFYMASTVFQMLRLNQNDVIYDTLPLYHTAGGIVGVGQTLINGCTTVIRKKFSASRFWDDCLNYNCTVGQYIGEICRYLLAQPYRVSENTHRVRVMYGNGIRPQIWETFQKRFNIDLIGEFYGATEGNANMINIDNTVGAVGFTTRLAPSLYPISLIRVDNQTGEPLRDRNGMCILAEPGEPGELVGKIVKGDPLREFNGYVNNSASSKKVVKDIFKKGDLAFLTGDVLVMDEYGYMFFKDRTGDTFRWRGENVSTSEVEATVSNIIKLNDAVCYGVEVPGSEGKAGMVAIVDKDHTLDLASLCRDVQRALPAYARPLFIRLMEEVDTTGTFKLKKTDLRKEGFDPSAVSDRLYYLDAKAVEYKPINKEVYQNIVLGKIRL